VFARASGRFLMPALAVTGALAGLDLAFPRPWLTLAAGACLAVLLFFLWFFRDPQRIIGDHVVSPADGKVIYAEDRGATQHLAIFMTPVSVHVNRAPLAGRIEAMTYHQGAHVPAYDKESEKNERLEIDLAAKGQKINVKLIAGTVARRIHPYLTPGAEVKKGDRLGLIAFGSRCELTLPSSKYRLTVTPGTWVRAGESTVAHEVA